MSEIAKSSIEDRLWHKMLADLERYVPDAAQNQRLMCCTCGRFLPREDFDLEHLIPQQALKADPTPVKSDPATPKNVRAGNLLLCKKPLKIKGEEFYANGCNSWKGRHYDKAIGDLLSDAFMKRGSVQGNHLVAALSLGYLAMVSKFGYQIALIQSGLLMRRQFFEPKSINPKLPILCHMVAGGSSAGLTPDAPMWGNPFSFEISDGFCSVVSRTFAVKLPLSRDPRVPLAKHLSFAPQKYKLRPYFETAFD